MLNMANERSDIIVLKQQIYVFNSITNIIQKFNFQTKHFYVDLYSKNCMPFLKASKNMT